MSERRPAPETRRARATGDRHWEEEKVESEDATLKLAGFHVGAGMYGIDIMRIKEVIQARSFPVRPVPHAPAIIEGVITLRGVVIPVVDLRSRFSVPIDESLARLNKLIIVSVRGRIVGLKVDRVTGEVRINPNELRPTPSMLNGLNGIGSEGEGGGSGDFFSGVCKVGDEVLFVLDLDHLFGMSKRNRT